MQLILDDQAGTITRIDGEQREERPLYSREGFEWLSREWVRVGWNEKYVYTFSWLGRPIIQLPEDMIRIQEVIYHLKPDVIIETGVAHGGSLIFYAGLCKILGKGRIVGVDIEIRPHNRTAIEAHPLFDYITLIEGDSASPTILDQVKSHIKPGDVVLVLLDSDHSKLHVSRELEAYAPLVTPGSYLVATDGVMQWLADVPRGKPNWDVDNPTEAAREFAEQHPEFTLESPVWPFNESKLTDSITHWPGAWLRRREGVA